MSQYFSEMFFVALFVFYLGLVQNWAAKKILKPRWKKTLVEVTAILPVLLAYSMLAPEDYLDQLNMSAFLIGAILGMLAPYVFRYLWRLRK